eukprot:6190958-Pleurochrysis_carterae.AAC.4
MVWSRVPATARTALQSPRVRRAPLRDARSHRERTWPHEIGRGQVRVGEVSLSLLSPSSTLSLSLSLSLSSSSPVSVRLTSAAFLPSAPSLTIPSTTF